jgi:hypothetical protein
MSLAGDTRWIATGAPLPGEMSVLEHPSTEEEHVKSDEEIVCP